MYFYGTSCSHHQGTPFANAHSSTCPLATSRVVRSHGQPFARAHCSTSRCPPFAALMHVFASHGQPFECTHCSI